MNLPEEAVLRMWMKDLDSRDHGERLVAGLEVCRMLGIDDAIRAVASDGSLRPAPAWPRCDFCLVGGGKDAGGSFLRIKVRTTVAGAATVEVEERVKLLPKGQSHADSVAEAVERGREELARKLASFTLGGKS